MGKTVVGGKIGGKAELHIESGTLRGRPPLTISALYLVPGEPGYLTAVPKNASIMTWKILEDHTIIGVKTSSGSTTTYDCKYDGANNCYVLESNDSSETYSYISVVRPKRDGEEI